MVQLLSFKRRRFPADAIRQAVWLYFRFTLSLRDVEELLAERGTDVSYETVRCWIGKFGPQIAANLRRRRCSSDRPLAPGLDVRPGRGPEDVALASGG